MAYEFTFYLNQTSSYTLIQLVVFRDGSLLLIFVSLQYYIFLIFNSFFLIEEAAY